MGRQAKRLILTNEEQAVLERGYKHSKSVSFSRRCHMVLLKGQGRTSEEIAQIMGTTIQPVNRWVNRYEAQGIAGLQTKPGQGRKPILDENQDQDKVRAIVKKERQRLSHAKEELESALNKKFSLSTFKRFLKNLSADGNASD